MANSYDNWEAIKKQGKSIGTPKDTQEKLIEAKIRYRAVHEVSFVFKEKLGCLYVNACVYTYTLTHIYKQRKIIGTVNFGMFTSGEEFYFSLSILQWQLKFYFLFFFFWQLQFWRNISMKVCNVNIQLRYFSYSLSYGVAYWFAQLHWPK